MEGLRIIVDIYSNEISSASYKVTVVNHPMKTEFVSLASGLRAEGLRPTLVFHNLNMNFSNPLLSITLDKGIRMVTGRSSFKTR